MKLSDARRLARHTAIDTNKATFVYQDKTGVEDYDVAYSIPDFGIQVGESFIPPVKPEKVHTESDQTVTAISGYSGGAAGTLYGHGSHD